MDEDLRQLTAVHDTDLARIAAMTLAATELRSSLEACNAELPVLQGERDRLTALWEEENRRRHDAENAPDLSWIPWAIAGGFAISTIVLAIIVGVQ
jgi:hypothetical protein